ncbi:MAG: hypothetical protein WKG06_15810 [Segetibacter sp.]
MKYIILNAFIKLSLKLSIIPDIPYRITIFIIILASHSLILAEPPTSMIAIAVFITAFNISDIIVFGYPLKCTAFLPVRKNGFG